jgi:pimeloyl-ACP methyl ester carboxylesterase
VFLKVDPMVFGIVSEPSRPRAGAPGALLLNDGATSHIGANGLYVSLARQWARRGCTVLRMDLAGLGDSGIRRGRPGNEVFPPAALQDLRAAIEYLRKQHGVQQLTILGLCAGAYHALRAALEPLPIQRLIMVNPQVFFWKEGMAIGARWMRIRWPGDLGWQLEDLAARGVQIVFAFSRDDTGIELLRLQAGSAIRRCGARIHIIDGADHIFSQSGPRQELERVLSAELFAAPTERPITVAPAAAASSH